MSELSMGLTAMGLNPEEFVQGDNTSARGPCFLCGGHHRLVVFFDREFPHWWLHCDGCFSEGWADQFFPGLKQLDLEHQPIVTAEEFNHDLKEAVDKRIAEIRSNRNYQAMHDQMEETDRAWWRSQGIPDAWQDFWHLGVIPEKTIYNKQQDKTIVRKAYSIPKFDLGWQLMNLDYRIYDPPMGWGKYRPEAGLPAAPFLSRPDLDKLDNEGLAIVMEGSKKAAVSSLYLGGLQVIGLPSCSSWAGIGERLKECRTTLIILDPDAEKAAEKLLETVPNRAIRVTLPTKVDDAFTSGALTKESFWRIVKMSGRRE